MTSLQRVLKTLSHEEPDRVPLFLLPTMHGAKELGLSIKEYFSKAENVVEGQLLLRKKYNNDCVSNFFYGPIEIEVCGGHFFHFFQSLRVFQSLKRFWEILAEGPL